MGNENIKNFLYHYNLLDQKDEVLDLIKRYKNDVIAFSDLLNDLYKKANIDFTKFTDFVDELLKAVSHTQEDRLDDSVKKDKEILESENLINSSKNIEQKNETVESFIESLIKKFAKKDDLKKRLLNIVIFFLKEKRGELLTYEQLIKSIKTGGIGLNASQANGFLKELKKIKSNFEEKELKDYLLKVDNTIKTDKAEDLNIDVQDKLPKHIIDEPIDKHINKHIKSINRMKELRPADLSTEIRREIQTPKEQEKKKVKENKVIPKEINELIEKETVNKVYIPKKTDNKQINVNEVKEETKEVQREVIYGQKSQNERPLMSDVKYVPSVVGPVEELSAITLIDFRRLSNSPKESAEKILQKIKLLENESFVKKNEGVEALRKSPLYRVYSQIMNQSIIEGISLEEAVAKQTEITDEEFNAIMNMNRKLRA